LRLVHEKAPAQVWAVGEITLILQRVTRGDDAAASELIQCVYRELRQLAAAKLGREAVPQTLQPTAPEHEAWLRLCSAHPSHMAFEQNTAGPG